MFLAGAFAALPQIPSRAPAEYPPFGSAASPSAGSAAQLQGAGDPTLYDCGDPTDLEQQCLELINRARANPMAEALRLAFPTDADVLRAYAAFNVDTNLLVAQFALIQPAQPLAFSPILIAAGRQHSQWMLANDTQSHAEGALSTDQRFINAGYPWNKGGAFGENIFAYSESVPFAHVGFDTDWGNGPGGMQTPAGHRHSIHDDLFREAGIGVIFGTNASVGPQLVTEEFGLLQATRPFVTGVAYYDLNGNQIFDPGEGIQGIRVDVEGADRYAITTSSGAYAIPFSGSGARRVQFSGGGFPTSARIVTLLSERNVKVDFIPDYRSPTIAGPATAAVSKPASFFVSRVGGAVGYEVRSTTLSPLSDVEGAENGANQVIADISSYPLIVSDVKLHGARAFHLAHPKPARPQSFQLARRLLPRAESRLSFASRLGWASPDQTARAQISTDDGAIWQDLWSRSGTGDKGQTAFEAVNVALASFAGQESIVRFLYDFSSGNYFPQTDRDVGFYVDDIAFTAVDEVLQPQTNSIPAVGEFDFTRSIVGRHRLQARAVLSNHTFPFGPVFELVTSNVLAAVSLRLLTPSFVDATHWSVPIQVTAGSPTFFSLESASASLSGWTREVDGLVESLGGGRYRISVTKAPGAALFFRVRAQ
ncbi:MAG: hypothetical protein HYR88_12170 [Verrucomicrobia bacterium]|nr:hypothetical protein [Verrucomicrobiota bacterium]